MNKILYHILDIMNLHFRLIEDLNMTIHFYNLERENKREKRNRKGAPKIRYIKGGKSITSTSAMINYSLDTTTLKPHISIYCSSELSSPPVVSLISKIV